MKYIVSYLGSFSVDAASMDEAVQEAKKYPDLFVTCAYSVKAEPFDCDAHDEYLLVGHELFAGGETFYFRGTDKGIGGAKEVSRAKRFTLEGARMNQIPPYDQKTGRGWEIVRFMEARDLS